MEQIDYRSVPFCTVQYIDIYIHEYIIQYVRMYVWVWMDINLLWMILLLLLLSEVGPVILLSILAASSFKRRFGIIAERVAPEGYKLNVLIGLQH